MRALIIFGFLLGLSSAALALDDADRSAVQGVIDQQLTAFSSDNAAAAYSHAAPNIKAMFPNQDIFMELVRKGYQPVYRSQSHTFGEVKETPMGLQQTVDIIDSAGEFWTAVYTVQKQPDGSWQISSCVLVQKPGEVA